MRNCLVSDIRLGKLLHFDSRHHPRVNAHMLKYILKSKTVYRRRKHTHMVCTGAIHIRSLSSTPYVSRAHNYADLRSGVNTTFYNGTDFLQIVEIENASISRESFSGELDKHPFVCRFFHKSIPLYSSDCGCRRRAQNVLINIIT